MATKLDPVTTEILWARLQGIVDQAAVTLMRTAFSGGVRDSHDFGSVLCDATGRLITHDTRGTPGLIGTLPFLMRGFLSACPPETLREGDVLLTNDPWLATGHMLDLSIARPIFHRGRLVAFGLVAAHLLDIGGRKATTESREIYEEGLRIPVCKLYQGGIENDLVLGFLRANVRVPHMVIGDLRAQVTSTDLLDRRVQELLADEGMDDLEELSNEILGRTEATTRASIRRLPDGRHEATTLIDRRRDRNGRLGEPLRIHVAVTIEGDNLLVDFDGSSPQVDAAVNCTRNMMHSYVLFSMKSVLDPSLPSNDGFVRAIQVSAPEGSIVNARFPAAVYGRTEVSQYIPQTIYQALAESVSDHVIAGSGSTPTSCESFLGTRRDGRPFAVYLFLRGGLGGRPGRDGASCVSFPANSANLSTEAFESEVPAICESKQLMPDSGGPGQYRGGLGQEVAVKILEGDRAPAGPIICGLRGGRVDYDVPGVLGGHPTGRSEILYNGRPTRSGQQVLLEPGDRLVFRVQGGGGCGAPGKREPWRVADDIRNGLVSPEQAGEAYGVALEPLAPVREQEKPE